MDPRLVNFKKVDGDLHVSLTAHGEEEMDDILERNRTTEDALRDLFEYQLCNGWDVIRPEEIGALTDSIILSDSAVQDDNGKLVSIGTVYWHPNYMVEDPVEILRSGNVFVMTGEAPDATE